MTSVGQAPPPGRAEAPASNAPGGASKRTAGGPGGFWQLLQACFPHSAPAQEGVPEEAADGRQMPAAPEQDSVSFLEQPAGAVEMVWPAVAPPVVLALPPLPAEQGAGLPEAVWPVTSPAAENPMPALPVPELGLASPKLEQPTAQESLSQPNRPQGEAASPAANLLPEAGTQPRRADSAMAPAEGSALSQANAGAPLAEIQIQGSNPLWEEQPTSPPEKPPGPGAGEENQGASRFSSSGQNEGEMRASPSRPDGGISFATPSERMVSHAETEKLAESGLQKVPDAALGQEATKVSPAVLSRSAGDSSTGSERGHRTPAAADLHAVPTAPGMGTMLPAADAGGDSLNALAATQPARLARVATEIQEMAVELLHFKADSLSVLIRPDADTALHLRLMVVAGRVYAEARLQSGDGAWLQSAWGDLQRVLTEQNIVLEPLKVSAFHPQPGQWGAERQPERAPQPQAREELPAAKAALTPVAAQPPARKRRLSTGWEWWA